MTHFHSMNIGDVLETLQSSVKGLDDSEARARLVRYGPNELRCEKQISPLRVFAEQFKEILIIILLAATFLSFVVEETVDALVILAIVFACAILGFAQEYRAERSLEALKKMAAPTATVTALAPEDRAILQQVADNCSCDITLDAAGCPVHPGVRHPLRQDPAYNK